MTQRVSERVSDKFIDLIFDAAFATYYISLSEKCVVGDLEEYPEEVYAFTVGPRKIPCVIARHRTSGHLCGYFLRPQHQKVDTLSADVHGGITGSFFLKPYRLVGFDCGHDGDFTLDYLWFTQDKYVRMDANENLTYYSVPIVRQMLIKLVSKYYYQNKEVAVSNLKSVDETFVLETIKPSKAWKRRQRRKNCENRKVKG